MAAPKHASYKVRGDNLVASYGTDKFKPYHLRLIGYDWILQWSHQNPSDNSFTRKTEVSIGVRSLKGEENSLSVAAGVALKGLSLGISGEHKTFTQSEVSATKTETREVTIKPHTNVYYYQKIYNFLVSFDFFTSHEEERIFVNADEVLTSPVALEGEEDITIICPPKQSASIPPEIQHLLSKKEAMITPKK